MIHAIYAELSECLNADFPQQGRGRGAASTLYSEAILAFHCHLQDPDEAVARECK